MPRPFSFAGFIGTKQRGLVLILSAGARSELGAVVARERRRDVPTTRRWHPAPAELLPTPFTLSFGRDG